MRAFRFAAIAIVALRLAASPPAAAAAGDVKILCSTGLKAVMDELAPRFERETGYKVAVRFGVAAVLKDDIDRGEPFDVAILTPTAMDEMIARGRIAAGTRIPIARTPMAIAVRAGARKPDISTVDALKRTLLDAKSIAYAKQGASGVYFMALIQRLGIASALQPKARETTNGLEVGTVVAGGDAELGILPLSEILPIRGTEVLGTFPAEVQDYIVMVGGVGAAALEKKGAADLIAFLTAPAARPVITANGMESLAAARSPRAGESEKRFPPLALDDLKGPPRALIDFKDGIGIVRVGAMKSDH